MYRLQYTQKIPISLEECWDFFSNPANLKTLTPKHLGFEIKYPDDLRKMYSGQVIAYTLYPLFGIPIEWVSEITHLEPNSYFIDEQKIGPYKFWHHEHRFKPISEGVEVTDTVYYKMPFGVIGKAFHELKVKKDLAAIFAYRRTMLEKIFGA